MFGSSKFNRILKHPGYNEPTTLAIAGLAVSAAGGVMQYQASQEAAKAQKEAEKAKQRMAEVEAQRERIKQVREARIRRAQIVSSGTNTGLGGASSGIVGATSSVAAQTASNIGTINQMQDFATTASQQYQKAADAGTRAAGWQTIGTFGKSIFDQQGGFTTIFGGNTPNKVS